MTVPQKSLSYFSRRLISKGIRLSKQNEHPLDPRIQFDPVNHTYTYQGQPINTSVTEIVKNYFETFDAKEVAAKMVKSVDWPRVGYIHEPGNIPYTVEEIIQKWKNEGELSRNEGTLMHESIEDFLNGKPIVEKTVETEQFDCFYRDVIQGGNITPYRTEWKICAPNISLAGSVDFVGQLPDGSFIIMDWKRTKRAPYFFKFEEALQKAKNDANSGSTTSSSSSSSGISSAGLYYRKAKPPVQNLFDCDEMKYSLQLNFYKYILTNYYSMKVSRMMIVAFHPKLPSYATFEVKDLQNEIHEIICNHITKNFVSKDK
jgi:hypothetical protein